jgi:hypothetical protein
MGHLMRLRLTRVDGAERFGLLVFRPAIFLRLLIPYCPCLSAPDRY